MIYWVNQQGSLCLAFGAVMGFAGAGLGKLVGPHLGLGEGGYVFGVAIAGLTIIAVDIAIRARAYLNYKCGLFGAFLFPSNGGMVNWVHASLDGLLVVALGIFLVNLSFKLESRRIDDAERKIADKKETERLDKITQRLPREGIDVAVNGNDKGIYTITLTNKTGKDFAKVRIVTRAHYMGGTFNQTLNWPQWKQNEAKTFTDPGRGGLVDFGFDMEGYSPGADEPRFIILNFGYLKNGRWEQAKIGK